MMTFLDVLKVIRAQQLDKRDRGFQFEMLMKRYLKTDPKYANILADVWLWAEFPYGSQFGDKDLGIDLVARHEDGGYWAIQCKCYEESITIQKADVDTFLATSGKTFQTERGAERFDQRVWISTTNNWSKNAEITLKGQSPSVIRVLPAVLESSTVDWEKLYKGEQGKGAVKPGKQLMEHQRAAIQSAVSYYQTRERGKLIMACGTGKTFTSLRIAETIVGQKGLVLFMVPSIALLGQALNDWFADAQRPIKTICVCSDAKASAIRKRNQNINLDSDTGDSILDIPYPASTNADSILRHLNEFMHFNGLVVVFSTYQSIDVVSLAQQRILEQTHGAYGRFDFIVCDEAHRTTGVKLSGATKATSPKYTLMTS